MLLTQPYLLHGPFPQLRTTSATRPAWRTKGARLHSADWVLAVVISPPPQGSGPAATPEYIEIKAFPPRIMVLLLRDVHGLAMDGNLSPYGAGVSALQLLTELPRAQRFQVKTVLAVINRENKQPAA